MNSALKITAVILSGGRGKRFGGQDKGLQSYRGRALIEHVIAAIEPQVGNIIICANRNLDIYAKYGFTVVQDQNKDHQGPMAGISAAIAYLGEATAQDAILISSCDSPALTKNYVATIADKIGSAEIAVVNDGQRNQNLHCLIKSAAWPSLLAFFDGGGRAMHRWFKQVGIVEVDFSEQAKCFNNINLLAELEPQNDQ